MKDYQCVSCNARIHLTSDCTALSPVAINGIRELGLNAVLLCNACVENNERDNFIRGKAIASVNERLSEKLSAKLDNLDVGEKLKTMEQRLTDLVDEKIGNAVKTTREKVEHTNSAFVAVKKSTGTFEKSLKPQLNANLHENPKICFRIQGEKEDPAQSKDENFDLSNEKVKEVLTLFDVKPEITDIKRLGKFDKDGKTEDRFDNAIKGVRCEIGVGSMYRQP